MSTYVITDLRPVRPTVSRREQHRVTRVRAASSGQLRLTRRGRAVVFAFAVAVVLALSVLVMGGSVATSEKGVPAPTETITVGPGDTLWAISSDIAAETGQDDVREVMAQIEDLNSLDSAMLMAGQELRIPLID